MSLDRAGLLAALAIRTQTVPLPTGGDVLVRTLTAAERINLSTSAADPEGKVDSGKFSALMVAATVVDDAGNRLFNDEDVPLLLGGASDVFEALFAAARGLNSIGNQAVEAAKGN